VRATKSVLQRLLSTAVRASQAAECVLLKHWRGDPNDLAAAPKFRTKVDRSPVTRADREAENAIRQTILAAHPEHMVFGEEFGRHGDPGSSFVWVVDPIDGTKQFVRGLACFGTLIAVVHRSQVIVAVSNAPALRETVVATRGGGAFLNGHRLRVSRVAKIAKCLISHGGITHFERTGHLASLTRICRDGWGEQGFSDFRSYHLVASGRVDVVLEAEARAWDLAAVSLVVEEAGGQVTDMEGGPFSLATRSMVATNGLVHDQVLSYFTRTNQYVQ